MFKFKGDPYNYNFYLAEDGSSFNDKKIIFRVREGIDPKLRAEQKGIKYWDRILPCTYEPFIQLWLDNHPDYKLEVRLEDLLLKSLYARTRTTLQ